MINNTQLTKEKGIKRGNMKTDDKYESEKYKTTLTSDQRMLIKR